MARLVYSAICSVDGYTVDADGRFDWAAPDEEVHAFVNDLERTAGTYLYGRRMYETMRVWQTMDAGDSAAMRDYAEIWRAADKIVFSRTLEQVTTPRTRLEQSFGPKLVQRLKDESDRDLTVGGATLAGEALKLGLVDEVQLLLVPVIVGGGTRVLPPGVRIGLKLMDERRFAGGVVFVSYGVMI